MRWLTLVLLLVLVSCTPDVTAPDPVMPPPLNLPAVVQ